MVDGGRSSPASVHDRLKIGPRCFYYTGQIPSRGLGLNRLDLALSDRPVPLDVIRALSLESLSCGRQGYPCLRRLV
jgi:hypothetical protein